MEIGGPDYNLDEMARKPGRDYESWNFKLTLSWDSKESQFTVQNFLAFSKTLPEDWEIIYNMGSLTLENQETTSHPGLLVNMASSAART